jgi:trimeric autotransporter adhesin
MSTKTNFKRVALVAVAALGLGVLTSVAPANALTGVDRNTVGYTATGSVGICKAPVNDAADANQASGEVLVGGTVAFTIDQADLLSTTGDQMTITLSGPAKIASFTPSTTTPAATSYGAGLTSLAIVGTTTTATQPGQGFSISATGAGTIQITVSKNALAASASVQEYYYITASATCATNALSVANSLVQVTFAGMQSSSSLPTTNTTAATAATTSALANRADRIANGGYGLIAVRVMDGTASGGAVLTTAGIFGASATNGAVVDWNASSTLQSSSAFETATGHNTLTVWQGTANKDKPMSTVVTVTYNGVVLGSRTINFTGKATAITIDSANAGVGKSETANIIVAGYEITDAAGNKLTSEGPGITGASEDNAALLATSGVVLDTVSQSLVTAAASSISNEASGYNGAFGWTCGAGSGSAKIQLKYTFSDLSSLTSNTHDAACGYGVRNYKASLDKATYAPGEIATLTITATDKNGKAVYDADNAAAGAAVGTFAKNISVSLPQLTPVSTPTYSDVFVGSKKTYKFTVGTTEGSFSGVVDLPEFASTLYAQAAQTVSYKVAGAAGVSNADVLKAIVSLIASINKQIAALQKALLRR